MYTEGNVKPFHTGSRIQVNALKKNPSKYSKVKTSKVSFQSKKCHWNHKSENCIKFNPRVKFSLSKTYQ